MVLTELSIEEQLMGQESVSVLDVEKLGQLRQAIQWRLVELVKLVSGDGGVPSDVFWALLAARMLSQIFCRCWMVCGGRSGLFHRWQSRLR